MNEVRLIDANSLTTDLKKYYPDSALEGIESKTLFKQILHDIDNAPTVPLPDFKEGYKQAILDGKTNYSRPEGEWIIDGCGHAFCNKCNYEEASEDCWAYNYCPHCGADMKGSKNEKSNI